MSSLEDVLRKWNDTKTKIACLQKKNKHYRDKVDEAMTNAKKRKVSTGGYTATKSNCIRESISKSNVPDDVWNKYKSVNNYTQISLKYTFTADSPKRKKSSH